MSVIAIRLLLPVCLAALMIAWLPAAEPDGETVSFSAPSKVGPVVLPAGLYRLKVQGALVFFTDVATKKSFSALVRLEKMARKSSFTAAQAKPIDGGQQQVDAIIMQGLDYKLVF